MPIRLTVAAPAFMLAPSRGHDMVVGEFQVADAY